jgi:site-specific recombinase XerD
MSTSKLTLEYFTAEEIGRFRKYLANKRKNCARTRNQRMAAIHSFVDYLQSEYPDKMKQWQQIRVMPSQSYETIPVKYLTQKEFATLMSVIRTDSRKGLRDKAMMLLLYDSGGRVQEIVDLTIKDIRLDTLPQVTLTGKGKKSRIVPLMPTTVKIMKEYFQVFNLLHKNDNDISIFKNRQGEKFTRFGVLYLLKKYTEMARKCDKNISNVTPHILRHSKAMHLLEQGVSEIVIQRILGHVDIKTTSVYARANIEMTRDALKKVNGNMDMAIEEHSWLQDDDLMSMLENL